MILRNHGFVVCGQSVEDALHLAFHVIIAAETQVCHKITGKGLNTYTHLLNGKYPVQIQLKCKNALPERDIVIMWLKRSYYVFKTTFLSTNCDSLDSCSQSGCREPYYSWRRGC